MKANFKIETNYSYGPAKFISVHNFPLRNEVYQVGWELKENLPIDSPSLVGIWKIKQLKNK